MKPQPSTGSSKSSSSGTYNRTTRNSRESGAGVDFGDRSRTLDDRVEERLDEINKVLHTLITKEYMDEKIAKLKDDITAENRELLEKLEGRIFELETENDQLRQTIGNLETKVDEMEFGQRDLQFKYNDIEQHGRKNSIRISGLSDPSDKETVEECVGNIVKFVNEKLRVPLRSEDIDIAHRLGRFSRDKPRNIIVKFTHRRKEQEIIKERRKLKSTGTTIFEDMTKFNQQRLRDAFRLNCVKNSYSMDGKLFVVLQNGKKRKLCFDTPLEENYLLKDANFSRY